MDSSVACHTVARAVVTSCLRSAFVSTPHKGSSSLDEYSAAGPGNFSGVFYEKKLRSLLGVFSGKKLRSFLLEKKWRHVQSEAAISIVPVMRNFQSLKKCSAAFAHARSKEQLDVDDTVGDDSANSESGRSNGTSSTEQDVPTGSTQQREKEVIGASLFSDKELLRRIALLENVECAVAVLSQNGFGSRGIISSSDCSTLLDAALAVGNIGLAYSVLNAMHTSQTQRRLAKSGEKRDNVQHLAWQWPQADVETYITLIRGLATTLRVSDAIFAVNAVKRRGVPSGEEVLFGKVVNCPSCLTALAVVQPHQGIQLVPCSKCRYQYELMSGDVVKCESESISTNISAFEKGLRAVKLVQQALPSAVHSFVVRAPDGSARTHRFATKSADVPAQEGERITVAAAAPMKSSRGIGPFKFSARTPGWRPSEPMCITNHATDCVYPLLRAPPKIGSGAALDTSFIIPAALLLASSDAATALIDPTLPRTIAIAVAAATVFGTVANTWLLPQFNQLPQRTVDAIAVRQELLAQYEVLQTRLQELAQGAMEEVRVLARMSQLYNKMEALQETAYSARMDRVGRARDGLDQQLASTLKLIDNYAKVSSMIEIEVEMDLDVSAAEAGSTMASITAQIERLEEVERLQKQWKLQAEANDELERLLQSSPALPDIV